MTRSRLFRMCAGSAYQLEVAEQVAHLGAVVPFAFRITPENTKNPPSSGSSA
jgi:hypothetical protein